MRKAFTLIELLVVISIIALLIAILLPVLGSTKESSRRMECAANTRSVLQGYVTLATDNNGYYRLMSRGLGGGSKKHLTFASNVGIYNGVGQTHISQLNRWVYADMLEAGITLNNFACPNRGLDFIRGSNKPTSQQDLLNPIEGSSSHFRIAFYSMIGNDQSLIRESNGKFWYSPRSIEDDSGLPAVACIIESGTIGGPFYYPHGPKGTVERQNSGTPPDQTTSDGGNVTFNDGSTQFVPTDQSIPFRSYLPGGGMRGYWPYVDGYDQVNPTP